jgi:hypothetical protein
VREAVTTMLLVHGCLAQGRMQGLLSAEQAATKRCGQSDVGGACPELASVEPKTRSQKGKARALELAFAVPPLELWVTSVLSFCCRNDWNVPPAVVK